MDSMFGEGISLVLSRWTALQIAVQNEWGGRDSRRKSEELASTLLSWFSQSKDPHYIDDLEHILDENMMLSFNTEIEDGSVEEVAEQLMIMHEDCLQGNYESVEKLRMLVPSGTAASQSRQVVDENEDESSDEEVSDMMVDEPKPKENSVEKPKAKQLPDMMADEPKPKENSVEKPKAKQLPDEDGWFVVTPRRNRGKKSG